MNPKPKPKLPKTRSPAALPAKSRRSGGPMVHRAKPADIDQEAKDEAAAVARLQRRIDGEIAQHETWCHGDGDGLCPTFLPETYRSARLLGFSAEALQSDYDSCHICR